MANLYQPDCEILFLHWVVTERKVSPYLSPTARLTCPVHWCSIKFNNHESLLCHLKNCPQLSASDYRCSRCRQVESFASNKIPEPIPGSGYQSPVRKGPSLLKKLLRKPFSRKRAPDPSQNLTTESNPLPKALELEAPVGTRGQQKDNFGGPDTLNMNSATLGIDWSRKFEMEDIFVELPTDGDQMPLNTSPEFSQFNELCSLVEFNLEESALYEQIANPLRRGSGHDDQVNLPEPARQDNIGQIDCCNSASGKFDHQKIPLADSRALWPTYPCYDPSYIPYQAEVQTPWNPRSNLDHAPRSTSFAYGLPHRQNPNHISNKSIRNTINVLVDGQRAIQGHANPETGPVNSPLSASSNQTNTTWSNESMGPLFPITPFSGAGSPTGSSPRNVFNSSARSSGSPRKNGFTCETCGRTINDISNLKRHKKHIHGEVVPTSCRAGCGKEFTRRDNEERHYEKQVKMERGESDIKRRKAKRFGLVHINFASNNNHRSSGTRFSAVQAEG